MRPLFLMVLGGLVATGCKYKQDEFAADYASATCTLYDECEVLDLYGYETDDRQSCVAALKTSYAPSSNTCEGFDPETAETCIMQIEQLACEQLYDDVFPTICDTVCTAGL